MMTRGGTFIFHRSASACCPLLTAETMVACLNPTPRFEIKPSLEPPNIGQKENVRLWWQFLNGIDEAEDLKAFKQQMYEAKKLAISITVNEDK